MQSGGGKKRSRLCAHVALMKARGSISNLSPQRVRAMPCRYRHRPDHPRLHSRFLGKDALLLSKRAYRIACCPKRFQTVMCHVAGPQGRLMDQVPFPFWPILQIINRLLHGRNLADEVLLFLQIHRTIKELRDHFHLTDSVCDQQGRRCGQRRLSMWFAASFRSSRNTTQVTKSDRETVYVDGSERRRLLHSKPGWRVADCPIPERDYAAAKNFLPGS